MSVGAKSVPSYQYLNIVNDRYKYYSKYQDLKEKQKVYDVKINEYENKVEDLINQNERLTNLLREQFDKHDRLIDDFNNALDLWKMDQVELESRKRTIDELNVKIYHLEKKKLIDLTNEPEMIDLTSEPESEPFSIDLNEPASDEE